MTLNLDGMDRQDLVQEVIDFYTRVDRLLATHEKDLKMIADLMRTLGAFQHLRVVHDPAASHDFLIQDLRAGTPMILGSVRSVEAAAYLNSLFGAARALLTPTLAAAR